MIHHALALFMNPPRAWQRVRDADPPASLTLATHTLPLALICATCGFIGTTTIGWRIGARPAIHLTEASAAGMAVAFFLAMTVATLTVGAMIKWMGQTYGATRPFARCFALASLSGTPLFLVGIVLLYPVLWLDLLIGLPALAYTIYVFYSGVAVMMEVPTERAFLFASAVMAFGLVALVAVLAVSVLLWSAGVGPAFTTG